MIKRGQHSLALFDFDGTITKSDSLLQFIRFFVGNGKLFIGLLVLSPILVGYKLKLIPNYEAKQKMLSWFFKGMREDVFLKAANEYSLQYIDAIVRLEALERIEWHKTQGHTVVVVSASIECWLKAWCDKNNLNLIATKLEIKNKQITGRLLTKNCYAKEKVNRLREEYDIEDYEYIYAYGDTSGDLDMLGLANESFYKPFR